MTQPTDQKSTAQVPTDLSLPGPSKLTRRESTQARVLLLPSEKAYITAAAKIHSMSVSAYLRALGCNYPIQSKADNVALLELSKINGDLGRLGGLLKMWLANKERAVNEDRLMVLLQRIEATQEKLSVKVDALDI